MLCGLMRGTRSRRKTRIVSSGQTGLPSIVRMRRPYAAAIRLCVSQRQYSSASHGRSSIDGTETLTR